MDFFLEVLVGGLLSGVMYSLVAIGFVLIYKASGVFNFAQGSMVLFAALTFVSLLEARAAVLRWPLAATLAVMVLLAPRGRARGAAPAGQPAADHAVHGDDRAQPRHRRVRPELVGRAGARPRPRASPTSHWKLRRHAAVASFDIFAAARPRPAGRGPVAVLQQDAHRPRRCAPWPTIRWPRWPSASACSGSG